MQFTLEQFGYLVAAADAGGFPRARTGEGNRAELSGDSPGPTLASATLANTRKTRAADICSQFWREPIGTEKIPGITGLQA